MTILCYLFIPNHVFLFSYIPNIYMTFFFTSILTFAEFGASCILRWSLSKPKIVSNITVSRHVYVPVAMCCVIELCVCACVWYNLDRRRNHIDFSIVAQHRTQSSYQPAVMHRTPKTETCDNNFQFTSSTHCYIKIHRALFQDWKIKDRIKNIAMFPIRSW